MGSVWALGFCVRVPTNSPEQSIRIDDLRSAMKECMIVECE